MKKYELALVIAPTLDEEALAAEKASVNFLLKDSVVLLIR